MVSSKWHKGRCRHIAEPYLLVMQDFKCVICGGNLRKWDGKDDRTKISFDHMKPHKSPGGSCGCGALTHLGCNTQRSNRHTIEEMWWLDRFKDRMQDHRAAKRAYHAVCHDEIPNITRAQYYEILGYIIHRPHHYLYHRPHWDDTLPDQWEDVQPDWLRLEDDAVLPALW